MTRSTVIRQGLPSDRLALARTGWWLFTGALLAAWAPAFFARFGDLADPSPAARESLQAAYISAGAHAVYHSGLDIAAAVLGIGAGAALLRRPHLDPLAMLSAYTVASWAFGSGMVESLTFGGGWRWLLLVPPWACWLALLRQSLRLRKRDGTLSERQRLRWTWYGMGASGLTIAAVTATVGMGATLGDGEVDRHMTGHLLVVLGGAVLPISLGLAWLRTPVPDPDTLIRRSLVYGGLSSIVLGTSILIVVLPLFLYPVLGPVYALAMICIWAVAGLRIQEQLQQVVNRMLYGQRGEPVAVLNELGRRLETGTPESMIQTIVETVAALLKVPFVAIEAESGEVMAATGSAAQGLGRVAILISHEGRQVGTLLVTPRARDESLDDRDREVLRLIARQAGPTVQAARLNQELRRSRREILASREEERRRIRRDLHDGLGPALAAIAMQADTARAIMDENPQSARAILESMTAQAEEVVHDVRRLVYQLRPPALDELGLVGAIERLARQNSSPGLFVEVEAHVLPELDAAVEVAAFRVTAEALTNVVRHSGAERCRVRIAAPSEAGDCLLTVDIEDDGRGLPEEYTAGIGIRSMQDRASEVGGRLELQRSDGGTRVCLRVPLEHAPGEREAGVQK
ncbi:MAG: sensor histidine kinase [Dehalococcoidia bacterium]